MNEPWAEDREFAMLNEEHIDTLNAIERIGSALSLFGISLIFLTFAIFKRLRTIPNTFIFFASIANIGACVACLIAYDGIQSLNKDANSSLCQAQGFIFEWFMQSDPWWSFAMAINVYMVFFMSWNPTTFRRYLWVYCVICYGLPAIPAFVFLFLRDEALGPVYGDAVLWCWIDSKWNILRIYSYYLPIWICSVLSAAIYFSVGYHVFHRRNQLHNLSLSNQAKDTTYERSDVSESAEKNLTALPGPGYYGTVTTEVQIRSDTIPTSPVPVYTNPFESAATVTNGSSKRPRDPATRQTTTSAGPELEDLPLARLNTNITNLLNVPGGLSPVHAHNYPWSHEPNPFSAGEGGSQATTATTTVNHGFNTTQHTSITAGSYPRSMEDDDPPSPKHLVSPSFERPGTRDMRGGRRWGPATGTGTGTGRRGARRRRDTNSSILGRMSRGCRRFGARLRNMDPVKLAYLRTSFVFAISILVTWTPSSINRVYTLIYPDRVSWGLNVAAAVVLPLQGVWNAFIYFTTSWKIFREEMRRTRVGRLVLERLGLGIGDVTASTMRQSVSFAPVSSSRTPRSEMGRNRRLGDESRDCDDVEMTSPVTVTPPRPRMSRTTSNMRVVKGNDDFV